MLEVLVHPLRLNEMRLVDQYQNILCNSKTIDIFDFTVDIAKTAATYRARYGLKTPDAIQIATAVNSSAHYFFTNDIRLKAIQEIEVLVLDELIKS